MSIPSFIFSIILMTVGYRYYGYCVKNFEPNNQRSKNLAIAVMLISMGFILFITLIIRSLIKA